MTNLIDLEGLPEPVAKAITETVLNLKNSYLNNSEGPPTTKPAADLPSHPGTVIGSLRRVDIYDER